MQDDTRGAEFTDALADPGGVRLGFELGELDFELDDAGEIVGGVGDQLTEGTFAIAGSARSAGTRLVHHRGGSLLSVRTRG